MTAPQLDLATTLLLARIASAHPGADLEELVRLTLAELDAVLDHLDALTTEAERRMVIIESTGRPTGLPPLDWHPSRPD